MRSILLYALLRLLTSLAHQLEAFQEWDQFFIEVRVRSLDDRLELFSSLVDSAINQEPLSPYSLSIAHFHSPLHFLLHVLPIVSRIPFVNVHVSIIQVFAVQ